MINAVIKSYLRQILAFISHQSAVIKVFMICLQVTQCVHKHTEIQASVRARRHKLSHNEKMKNIERREDCQEGESISCTLSLCMYVCLYKNPIIYKHIHTCIHICMHIAICTPIFSISAELHVHWLQL